eukprot:1867418-Prorocentrum_lima.AAC.1
MRGWRQECLHGEKSRGDSTDLRIIIRSTPVTHTAQWGARRQPRRWPGGKGFSSKRAAAVAA